MERRFNGPQNFVDMFGGVQPSRQAVNLARRAISLGEDPTALTQQAGIAAQRDGRHKVGFFGEAGKHMQNLKDVVRSIEGRITMQDSAKKVKGRY